MFPDIAPHMRFAYDIDGLYGTNTTYSIAATDTFLVGVLNSSVVGEYYKSRCALVRGGYLRFFTQYVEQIPIPEVSSAERAAITKLVRKCLDAKGVSCEAWEKEIDERVAALYGIDLNDIVATARPAPFYNTKGHLTQRVIPKLAMATPGFPYFSLDAIRTELEKHRGDKKPESLNHYLHELMKEGVIFDAGRGWYSTLSEPFVLDREPVRELVELLQKRFPLLEFSCWSTAQIAAYSHHQLGRFLNFVYVERDSMESVAEALREAGHVAYIDPDKSDVGRNVRLSDGSVVVRPATTRAPVDGKYADIEKILVDLYLEAAQLKLIDEVEYGRVVQNVLTSGRIGISTTIAYAERRNVPQEKINIGKIN